MKPVVLFFARDYQAKLFPLLKSSEYRSVYVVLNGEEKKTVLENGGEEIVCLEDRFDTLEIEFELGSYLEYSFGCDRNYIGLKLNEREIILKKTIIFWREVLTKYRPALIVNETVAIELAEVLAIEAKSLGIKYLSWMSFPKKNTFYWQVNPFHNSLKPLLEDVSPSENNMAEAKTFINGVKDGIERPFYVKTSSPRYSLLKIIKSLWAILLELRLIFNVPKLKRRLIYGSSIQTNLWNIKLFLLSLFNFSNKYDDLNKYEERELVFYPLHFEPEAVLFYMAYFFDNQVSVVENTLKCLKSNQILVVKEHPQQPGVLLEARFRNIKKRYPNLIFIRGEEPTTEILKKCSIVVTLGSTAGFEALALAKKVVNLGRVFYDSFESVNNCESFSQVFDLMRGEVPFRDSGNLEVFVGKMLSYLKEGNPFPHDQLYDINNIKAIKKAIEDELI